MAGPSWAIAAPFRAAASAQAALAYEVAEDYLRRALSLVATMAPGAERAEVDAMGASLYETDLLRRREALAGG